MKQAGEPVCMADLVHKPIPVEKNGATFLLRAEDDLNRFNTELAELAWAESADGIYGRYTTASLAKIKHLLTTYPNIEPLLEKAAVADEFAFPIDFSQRASEPFHVWSMPEIILAKNAARYLDAYAQLLLAEDQREEALQRCITLLRLSRQVKKDHVIVNNLVASGMGSFALNRANSILQSGPVNNVSRDLLEQELTQQDSSCHELHRALQAERAIVLDLSSPENPAKWLRFGREYRSKIELLDVFQDYLRYSELPYPEYVAAGKHVDRPEAMSETTTSSEEAPKESPLTFPSMKAQLQYSLQAALISEKNFQAQLNALRIIDALQKRVPSGTDRVPEIAELGLPKEAGIDPFNGKPMIVKRLARGWLVYSVGEDLQDNGGDCDNWDVGFGPTDKQADSKGTRR